MNKVGLTAKRSSAERFKTVIQRVYDFLIKSGKDDDPGGAVLRKAILDSFVAFNRKSRYKDVKLFYDIDPQSIM